jgi:hypothetical protein
MWESGDLWYVLAHSEVGLWYVVAHDVNVQGLVVEDESVAKKIMDALNNECRRKNWSALDEVLS